MKLNSLLIIIKTGIRHANNYYNNIWLDHEKRMLNEHLNYKTKRKRNTHFVLQGQSWTAETPKDKEIKLYSNIEWKGSLNSLILANSMKDYVKFLRMNNRKTLVEFKYPSSLSLSFISFQHHSGYSYSNLEPWKSEWFKFKIGLKMLLKVFFSGNTKNCILGWKIAVQL